MQNFKSPSTWQSPIKIVILYAVIGITWILVSDFLGDMVIVYWPSLSHFQTYKGVVFILVTACLLYLMIYKLSNKNSKYFVDLVEKNMLLQIFMANQQQSFLIAFDANWTVISKFGSDINLGLSQIIKDEGTTLGDIKPQISWYDKLWHILDQTANNTQYHAEIHINNRWYAVKGNVVYEKNSERLIVLMFSDKTESKDLLELNQIIKKDNAVLTSSIKTTKKSLDEIKHKYSEIFDSLPFPFIVSDMLNEQEGKLVDANKRAMELFRLRHEWLGDVVIDDLLDYDNNPPKWAHIIRNSLNTAFTVKFATFSSDKQPKLLTILSQNIQWGGNRYKTSMFIENSPFVIAYNQLDAQLSIRNHILDCVELGIMSVDKTLNCHYVNKKMAGWLHVDQHDEAAKPFQTLNNRTSLFHLSELVSLAFENKTPRSFEIQFLKNRDKWFLLSLYPTYGNQQTPESVVIVIEDVTEMKQKELKFLNNNLVAEEGNRLKSIFLANLSHEVRTPMNGILGFLDLLEMDDLTIEQANYLVHIRNSTDQLLNIINRMLEFAQIETHQTELHPVWTNMVDLQNRMENMAISELTRLSKTKVHFVFNTFEFANNRVLLDPSCLIRIFEQLISNAIKFTHEGQIEVDIKWDENKLVLTVNDTGIGIAPALIDAVFLPFTSFANKDGSVFDGIGLGLTIVKGLVEMQNGDIDLKSEDGKGTSFIIEIPIKAASINQQDGSTYFDKSLAKPEDPLIVKVKKVLVVEDSSETFALMKAIIEQLGLEVVHAQDGVSAIEIFYEVGNFDLVFCDIRLPDIDGFEVLSALRRIKFNIPVIANTAFVMNEDRRKCLNAGFNDYLAKPVLRDDILKILFEPPKVQF